MTPDLEIERRLAQNPTAGCLDKIRAYAELRDSARSLAYMIKSRCPETHERAVAMDRLDEAILWAVASIARS